MKTLQKYILSLLMIVSTVSISAMDGSEHQTLSLNSIAIKQIVAEELEQISTEQNKELHKKKIVPVLQQLERQARWKRNKNLTKLIMDQPWCTNNVLEMLVGSSGHAQGKEPYFAFLIDRKVRPWLLIDQQRSAIVQAVQTHNFDILKESCGLLDAYTSLFISLKAPRSSDFIKNYKNEQGMTLLHKTAENGKVEVVRLLLDRGANVDTLDNYGRTPLHMSAWNGNVEVVRLLLDCGANVDTPDNYGRTPLCVSALNGKVEVVRLLFDRGANVDTPDKDGWTLLCISAWNGNVEEVRLLLDRGANVDILNNYGRTPLHVSAMYGNVEVVRLLLDRGANVDTPDKDGQTPLHISAWNGKVEVVRLLLDRGANVDTSNNYGQTPLHVSAMYGNIEVVKLLLDRGANPDCKNNSGKTPDDCAADPEIKALFAQARIDRAKKAALENQNKKDS